MAKSIINYYPFFFSTLLFLVSYLGTTWKERGSCSLLPPPPRARQCTKQFDITLFMTYRTFDVNLTNNSVNTLLLYSLMHPPLVVYYTHSWAQLTNNVASPNR